MAKTEVAIVTEHRAGVLIPVPLLATALILQGTFAVINADGYAISSADVGGLNQTCLGIWDHSAENTGVDGDVLGNVSRKKQFLVRNSTKNPVVQADLGKPVYIEDNQTISKTDDGGNLSLGGVFMGFDTQYEDCVWVEI